MPTWTRSFTLGWLNSRWVCWTLTHRVAIANSRLVDFSDGSVAFRWKDYRHDSKPKVMQLSAEEFTRRFLLHVLPSGLQRIRHYGLLANRTRDAKLERCRELLGVAPPAPSEHGPDEDYRDRYLRLTGVSLVDCPACKRGRMLCIETLLPRPSAPGPPAGATHKQQHAISVDARSSGQIAECAWARGSAQACTPPPAFDLRGPRSRRGRVTRPKLPRQTASESRCARARDPHRKHCANSIPITPHRLCGRFSPTGSFTHPTRTSTASMISLRAPRRPGKRLSVLCAEPLASGSAHNSGHYPPSATPLSVTLPELEA
jgi:hypothetical protein